MVKSDKCMGDSQLGQPGPHARADLPPKSMIELHVHGCCSVDIHEFIPDLFAVFTS